MHFLPLKLSETMLLFFLLCICANLAFAQAPYDVRIVRDSFGMPHIFGQRDVDVAYGLAYAHAEDNFRDIQLQALPARGRLGSVLGKEGILFDYAMQFFGIDTFVDAHYERELSPEFRQLLQAYVDGLNAYAQKYPKELLVKGLYPFEVQDLVKGYTLTLTLMGGAGMALKAINDGNIDVMFAPNERGSNAAALSARRSEDGRSWLMINSHQPIEGRFAWYEVHLQSQEGWDMIGGLFPGAATVFVGTNPKLGWAHTVNYHNFGDVYELKTKGNKYFYEGKWQKFQTRKAQLRLKVLGMPLKIGRKLRNSVHGPVFKKKKKFYALRFRSPQEIQAGQQWYEMNKAQDFRSFEQAVQRNALSLFNIVYADVQDNIYYISDGLIPRRDSSLDWKQPVDGTKAGYIWEDLLSYGEKVWYKNPDCGFLFNCNNTPLQATCSNENYCDISFVGLELFTYNRGERFDRLFNALDDTVSWEDFLRIKYDISYDEDGSYRRKFAPFFELDPQTYPELADALQLIRSWDLRADSSSTAAGLMRIVHHELVKTDKIPFGFYMIRKDTISDELAVQVLRKAKKFMLKRYGSIEVPLGQINRLIRGDKSFALQGMNETVRAVSSSLWDKKRGVFRMQSGDGYIQFVKYGKGETEVESINAYGVSSHPESIHYTDQMQPFVEQKLRRVPWTREEIEAQARYNYKPGDEQYRRESLKKGEGRKLLK